MKMGYLDEVDLGNVMIQQKKEPIKEFMEAVDKCNDIDKWVHVENLQEQDYCTSFFIRKIAVNPIHGYKAYEVAILSFDTTL